MKSLHKLIDTIYQITFTALALYLIFLLLRYPALSLEYASTGLMLWFQKMIPTLLPFMILSGIMIRMNLTEKFVSFIHPFLHRIYGTSPNGSYTILMGLLCGFPMGARITGELYQAGKLSREESSRLLIFCNNIGPIYFLSFVVPTLAIAKPLIPFCIMYGIPLLYGIIIMRILPFIRQITLTPGRKAAMQDYENTAPQIYAASAYAIHMQNKSAHTASQIQTAPAHTSVRVPLLAAIDSSVISGLTGIAKLGGYMVFFNLLNIAFVPFSNLSPAFLCLYNCLLEITSGIDRGSHLLFYSILVLLPFGGFSCIAQTYSMIQHTDLSIRSYIFHKIIQTFLTALCYLCCSHILLL